MVADKRQTDGSIITPSERNNVVGIKPTVGLTSRNLVIPISEHQDTVGPIARTVRDAARLLQVIAGKDLMDPYTLQSPHIDVPDYLAACKLDGLQGKRIGIPRNVIKTLHQSVSYMLPAFEAAIITMRELGAVIVEDTHYKAFEQVHRRKHNAIPAADFVTNLEQYLSKLHTNPNEICDIHDLREWTKTHRSEEYPTRDTAVWDYAIESNISLGTAKFDALYEENMFLGGEGGILGALERHSLDAVILPSKIAFSRPALVGSPIITVPLNSTPDHVEKELEDNWDVIETGPGIPFGISFLGKKWEDEILVECAYAFEQASRVRKTLKRVIQPTADLEDVLGKHLDEEP